MFILFDIVFLLYSIIYLPYLLLTGRWHADFGQRFGFFPPRILNVLGKDKTVWVHAVSVGEVMAIEPLVRYLHQQKPELSFVCTVTTKTGYALAQEKLSDVAVIMASPLDISFIVRHFIRRIKPILYIAAETEIWPNLFHFLHRKKVPMAIINGRISDKSYGRYRMIKSLLKLTLSKVSCFAMQSDTDLKRIIDLGADPLKASNVGNIKFDQIQIEGVLTQGDPAHPVFIAGSTHPGEEEIILYFFKKLKQKYPSWRLMIVPRHIERCPQIMSLVERFGFKPHLFSREEIPTENGVVVVDTIGQLKQLYRQAALVFVGKSLCVGGGHNVIEPAMYGRAIIVGPRVENFRDIVACFKKDDALVQVADEQGFEQALNDLMADADKRQALGRRAVAVIDHNRGSLVKTYQLLGRFL